MTNDYIFKNNNHENYLDKIELNFANKTKFDKQLPKMDRL